MVGWSGALERCSQVIFGEMAKLVVCGTFMLEMPEKAGGEAGGPYWGWGEAVKWR